MDIVLSSRYSIHELCRCQARHEGEYYRLNMPFKMGLDFGCRRYGAGHLKDKVILVLEKEQYRYQAAISELAASDIEAHHGIYQLAVRKVHNWLAGMPGFKRVGARRVLADYEDFQEWHVDRQHKIGFSEDDIWDCSTAELLRTMSDWQQQHPRVS